jgi:hypothetical protein
VYFTSLKVFLSNALLQGQLTVISLARLPLSTLVKMRLIIALFIAFLAPANALAQNKPNCSTEGALSKAAQALLANNSRLDAETVIRAVRAAGSDVVSVRALWQQGGGQKKTDHWLTAFRGQADAPLVCGIGTQSNVSLVIAAARGGGLHAIGPKQRRIRGWLAAGFSQPQLVLVDATGTIVHLAATLKALAEGIVVSTDLPPPIRIQLVARGPGGPRPIAERVILPTRGAAAPQRAATRDAILSPEERDPYVHLGKIRRARGVPAVRTNRLLAAVAEAHAQAICRTGRIAHELGPGDNPERRLTRAGVRAQGIGEALAHGDSIYAAMAGLQRSPSHLMTLIDRRFTDAGIGVATDSEKKPCVVVLLAIWPRMVGGSAL